MASENRSFCLLRQHHMTSWLDDILRLRRCSLLLAVVCSVLRWYRGSRKRKHASRRCGGSSSGSWLDSASASVWWKYLGRILSKRKKRSRRTERPIALQRKRSFASAMRLMRMRVGMMMMITITMIFHSCLVIRAFLLPLLGGEFATDDDRHTLTMMAMVMRITIMPGCRRNASAVDVDLEDDTQPSPGETNLMRLSSLPVGVRSECWLVLRRRRRESSRC